MIWCIATTWAWAQSSPITVYGLDFDGQDDYATYHIGQANLLEESMSFGANINFNSLGAHNAILSRGDEDGSGPFYFGLNAHSHLQLWINGQEYAAEGFKFEKETCYHVAVTVSTDFISFYVDGELIEQLNAQQSSHYLDDISYFWIGNYPEEEEFGFNGMIDDVRIWNTTRTQGQIVANMININLNPPNIDEVFAASDFQFLWEADYLEGLIWNYNYVELPVGVTRPKRQAGCFDAGEQTESSFSTMAATPNCPPQSGRECFPNSV